MTTTFIKKAENCFTISIKGVLTFEDLKGAQEKFRKETDSQQKIKLLVLAEDFSGWGEEADWSDLTFVNEYENNSNIEKIAVVADEKWRDEFLMFLGAGLRKAEVMFFLSGDEQNARDWLQCKSE